MGDLLLGLDIGTSSSKAVLTSGGGLVVSDVSGRSQDVPELTMGAAYGDAALAAACLELEPLPTTWNRVAETVIPAPARRETYDELYRIYRDLDTATGSYAHRLAALQLASFSASAAASVQGPDETEVRDGKRCMETGGRQPPSTWAHSRINKPR